MPLLNWLNKNNAVNAAQRVPYRLLETVLDLSHGVAVTGRRPPIYIKSLETLHSGEHA
ncbi:hypothetical protein SPV1_08843 [Mariprofundus ferrooxydans PV-1]|jgi:hypothetical protein|uniref:Uncharacterized protein n=1 Tax=Mariprofundus ferrooxydans PV-1 TaxID=314345 RepID=Q0F096_9PROT|nr:hypothetical protein SPV1_08843 [Mariprofundus ferrooxydans PV-1]